MQDFFVAGGILSPLGGTLHTDLPVWTGFMQCVACVCPLCGHSTGSGAGCVCMCKCVALGCVWGGEGEVSGSMLLRCERGQAAAGRGNIASIAGVLLAAQWLVMLLLHPLHVLLVYVVRPRC